MGREVRGRGPAAAHHERHARREGPAVKAGRARACAERTENMLFMSVTLDVLKLSGWLNAVAYCRDERRAYDMRSEVWAEGGGAWAGRSTRAACTGRGPGYEGWGAIGHARSAP